MAHGATNIGFGRTIVGSHTQDTVDTATQLTPPDGARTLLVQAIGRIIKYTLDGTTPTPNLGFNLLQDEIILIQVVPNMILTFIEEKVGGSIEYQWGD